MIEAKRVKALQDQSRCDYCGCVVPTAEAQTQLGLHACDRCLAENCDDEFPTWADPAFAASALHRRGISLTKIEGLLAKAESVVQPWQLERVRQNLHRANTLYLEGHRLAALEAAQACWESANGLYGAMATRQAVVIGKKVLAGGRKGGTSSRQVRSGASSKRAAVLKELAEYQGLDAAKVATVARKANATQRYVRMIMADKKSEK